MSQQSEYTHSEKPALDLFQKMGYTYHPASQVDTREGISQVVLFDRLEAALLRINPWLSPDNLRKAVEALTQVQGSSLMEINQKIWELLRGPVLTLKQSINGVEGFHPVSFIDYEKVEQNDFLVVNQMKFHGEAANSIPDIVVFLNGLPIAVIECKSPTSQGAWDDAYKDLKYYQENSEKLFHFNQFCVALWEVGARYGAIEADKKFYSVFKIKPEEAVEGISTNQDILLYHLFRKDRLLDLIRHFVLFELVEDGTTVKKLPRYQQLRATNKTIHKLRTGEGGVVWHTQGSGKSLTMAYVCRKLQAREQGFDNPTILILTDRKDLDHQISTTLNAVGFKNVYRASSVMGLDLRLRNDYGGIITTTLQKFQETDTEATEHKDQTELEETGNLRIEKHIEGRILTKITQKRIENKWVEIQREEVELGELSNKKNLYVLVDEAHRSQYGFLASFMRTILPHAKFVAFTGTPISKEDKSTLAEFYGGDYIDVYTLMESVADGATVELKYDEGIARLDVKKEELDKEFKISFGHLPEEKQDRLKRKALKDYKSAKERIEAITRHIVDHYRNKIFPDRHKAMIVCEGRAQAMRYKFALEQLKAEGYHNFDSKMVITLGSPKSDPIAKDIQERIAWNKTHPDQLKPVFFTPMEEIKAVREDFKLPFGDEDERDKSGKKKNDNTAFLIVSDMLLTGYDAPIASCLYLDKPLKDHNLLQAIARVNRSRKGKNAGYIVDYYGITEYLIQALEIFSGDIRPDDILKNLAEELPKLALHRQKLVAFFKPLRIDREKDRKGYVDAAVRYIEPIHRRDEFKDLLKRFNKSLNIVLPDTRAMQYFPDFKLFNEIKVRAGNAFGTDDDLKITSEESKMLQQLIDEHMKAEGVENLLEEPVSILDREKFQEEIRNASPETQELKMRNKLKHIIKVGLDKNPDFFKPLAQRLEELIKLREQERITQLDLLKEYARLQDELIKEHEESASKGFLTEQQRAIYDSMKVIFGGNEEIAEDATHTFFDLINAEMEIVGWESKDRVQKDMATKLTRWLKSNLSRTEAKAKAIELIEILKKNKGA